MIITFSEMKEYEEEHTVLVWFRCKNFSSFKEEAILDMRAVKSYKEHPYNLISQEKGDSLIKVAGRDISNLRYVDDTTLMAESEEESKAS